MAEPIPPSLKIPEVSRFISRANQLRTIKPAISYWCECHAVNHIVSKGLHNADDEAFAFTRTLLERLETVKNERPDDETITDDTAAQAYVEQFARETFGRAERTMAASKVTRQTADTFDAAATFFDLTHEWGTPDAEVLQKIKFAKWNAARILKAIKEGRDPNESNPRVQEEEVEPQAQLDLNDPDVQQIAGTPAPRSVTVEDVSDRGEPLGTGQSGVTHEGYFPPPQQQPSAPPATSAFTPSQPSPASWIPPQQQQQPPPQIPPNLSGTFTPSPAQPSPQWTAPPPVSAGPPPPVQQPIVPAYQTPPPVAPVAAAAAPTPVQSIGGSGAAAPAMHQKDINQAQKHAKWAISALNFEDVPTAITELRNALAMLGAQ